MGSGSSLAGAAVPWCGRPAWALAGLLAVLCGAHEVRVEVSSSEVAYGGTVLLNCSSSCPEAGAPGGGLETSLSKEWVSRGPGWLSARLRNITEPLSDGLCYFSCFGQRKAVTFQVLAYDLPRPLLTLSRASAARGEPVAIECRSEPSRPPGLRLWLRGGPRPPRPPQPWEEGPVRLELTATEEDDGAEFACEGQLRVGNRTLRASSATATLRVTYEPRLEAGSCPPQQNWTEGQDETLRCWARGNPRPRLECARAGEPFPPGVPVPVTRAHAGTYRCRATNALGTAERNVTVWVHYDPPSPVLPALVGLVLLVVTILGAILVGHRIYHHKTKTGRYRPQQRQRQLEMDPLRDNLPPSDVGASPPPPPKNHVAPQP